MLDEGQSGWQPWVIMLAVMTAESVGLLTYALFRMLPDPNVSAGQFKHASIFLDRIWGATALGFAGFVLADGKWVTGLFMAAGSVRLIYVAHRKEQQIAR
jgi:hypothetical protein